MATAPNNKSPTITLGLDSKNEFTDAKQVENTCDSNTNEENDDETDLTSLTWLTELRNQNITFPNTLSITPDECKFPIHKSKSLKNRQTKIAKPNLAPNNNCDQKMQATPIKRATPAERYKIFLDKIKRDLSEYKQSASTYQTDVTEKPPFNYSHIIGMAMLENGRVTLQQICKWIEEKFAFFRIRKKWNNSIRHNLSLHYCFRKIDRNKFEKGKGGYWELGVDPKKCDRKRVRNRRSHRNKMANVGVKLTETSQKRHSLRKQPATLKEYENGIEEVPVLENSTSMAQVQNGIPLECSISEKSPSMTDIFQQSIAEQTDNCQQFHLGTIIINAAEADLSSTSLSLLGSAYDWSLQYQNFNGRENTTPVIPENINGISCVMDKAEEQLTDTTTFKNYINSSQNQDILLRQFNILPGSSLLRPNVIVEQVLQPQNSTFSTTESIMPLPVNCVTDNNETIVNSVNDNFRPYIDGIEEAFQYLRSIDQNNREDILDILDISVSDY